VRVYHPRPIEASVRASDRLLREQELARQALCACGFARGVVSER
jgi:hypothetical protein